MLQGPCVWGPAHRQPRHPLGQKAADSTSPPFPPGSIVCSLLCCYLSSACWDMVHGDWTCDPALIQWVCWECQWSRLITSSISWLPLISRVGDSRGLTTWLCFVGTLVHAGYRSAWASHCPSYIPGWRKLPLKQLHLQQGGGHWSQSSICSLLPWQGCVMELVPAALLVSKQAMALEAFLCLQWAQCTVQ